MTYKQRLLDTLQYGPVHYTDKRVVGHRMMDLQDMESRGLITTRLVEIDEQESYLEVRLAEGRDDG